MIRTVFFIIIVLAFAYSSFRLCNNSDREVASVTQIQRVTSQPDVSISLLYSSEKSSWLKKWVNVFLQENPDSRVLLIEMGSLDGARLIFNGEIRPTLWSPASKLSQRWLTEKWAQRSREFQDSDAPYIYKWLYAQWQEWRGPPIEWEGAHQPRSMLLSPLVFLVWECTLATTKSFDACESSGGWNRDLTWEEVSDRIRQKMNQTDQEITRSGGGEGADTPAAASGAAGESEGVPPTDESAADIPAAFSSIVHTNPSRSNSGLSYLFILYSIYAQALGSPELTAELIRTNDALRSIVDKWESLSFEYPASTSKLTGQIFRFGPERYNLVVTYENLALIRSIQTYGVNGRYGHLRVGYPEKTIWADHPLVLMNPNILQPAEKKLAMKLINFLLSPVAQNDAITYGFRPQEGFDPDDPDSLLYRAPSNDDIKKLVITDLPTGEVINELLKMWHSIQLFQTNRDTIIPSR